MTVEGLNDYPPADRQGNSQGKYRSPCMSEKYSTYYSTLNMFRENNRVQKNIDAYSRVQYITEE